MPKKKKTSKRSVSRNVPTPLRRDFVRDPITGIRKLVKPDVKAAPASESEGS